MESESERILRERREKQDELQRISDAMGKPAVEVKEHGKVDPRRDQASGSPASGVGSPAGSENPRSQDGKSPALVQSAHQEKSGTGKDAGKDAPLEKKKVVALPKKTESPLVKHRKVK